MQLTKRQDDGIEDLTDKQWLKLKPLLPQKSHTGQPVYDHRRILNGILWLHRTGAPWRARKQVSRLLPQSINYYSQSVS